MEIKNNTMEISNEKVKEKLLLDISNTAYATWLNGIDTAVMEDNNIIITVKNNFELGILESRYLELITNCYQLFMKFNKIEVRVENKTESILNNDEAFKIKSAIEIKEITEAFLAETVNVDKLVKIVIKNISKDIETMAKIGVFNILVPMHSMKFNDEVIKKIMDILTENLYIINLKTFSDERKYLEINWGV